MSINDIIVAPATALGGAIAVIRVSGVGSIACCDSIFKGRKPLAEAKSHTIHYGTICDGERVVDDVVVAIFRAPHSYTGEESVEISIHGSRYIASEVIRLLCEGGARMAEAGEFSQRALAAGRIDLSQAEAVADLIAAESRAAHAIAATQMRGGYSEMLDALREELLNITTLLELELDFSEEDVEFADRERLLAMLEHTDTAVVRLVESFRVGNAIREGVSVAIVGRPNVGKSTLLNRLVGDDRAMVSEIAGTTRDTIEESIVIDDIRFRFVDTAGLHDTDDRLEKMGIERTERAIRQAQIVLYMSEPSQSDVELPQLAAEQKVIVVVNKMDTTEKRDIEGAIYISARSGEGVDLLRKALRDTVDTEGLYRGDVIVSNMRHFEALNRAHHQLQAAITALNNGISEELLAEDIRGAITALAEITGRITSDDILRSVFSRFCIGK
ncbi:MAG: tRNA uridine-5-carboxymethylaminomethyl(34) synthesis GTPase MnmE [Alistipes sp.]|nr:tRNA uridine-5-carboxymethylaminomethyl(34) synthesis GTPase MnmE [Alistipes sp.]MBQ5836826.1 tRNA uridine-5-carboxymethylaminomethyl(34) synthesis GTPase MnmE [Alistipes sp.]